MSFQHRDIPPGGTPAVAHSRRAIPARKSGSRNRATLVAQALLENEKETLLRKAIELAKAGNVPMLSFLLGRILPKERSVLIDLPRWNELAMLSTHRLQLLMP